jgi:filamentous hemagglutinin
LKEKLAMEQAISDPTAGTRLPITMSDARWPASEGWVKMGQNIRGVEIHYVLNSGTGAVDDFKFIGAAK